MLRRQQLISCAEISEAFRLASDAEVRGLARALVRSGRAREIAVGGAWFLEFACDSQG
jgi:hypothetical protein